MKSKTSQNLLKDGKVYNQYLLVSEEPILIENKIKKIKEATKVNESFDFDNFVAPEVLKEEIIPKLYLSPIASARRVLVIKNLEEVDTKELATLAGLLSQQPSANCIIMSYVIDNTKHRKIGTQLEKLRKLFPKAHYELFTHEKAEVHDWIMQRVKRDNLKITPAIVQYLENEFTNDVTGLKNELDKIENYLTEAQNLDSTTIKDLAQGLCDFNKYQLADRFLSGKADALHLFEELKPYLHTPAELIYAITRGLLFRMQKGDPGVIQRAKVILSQLTIIDRKVKRGSYFGNIFLELLLILKGGHAIKGGCL